MKRLLFLAVIILGSASMFFSCKPSAVASTEGLKGDSILTGIERGPCFGRCPQYKAIIYTTGFAQYEGKRDNPRQGTFRAQLSEKQIKEVQDLLKTYKMAEADSEYVNRLLADYPAYWLYVSDRNGSRKVLVNHEAPPQNIKDFTELLDSFVLQLDWIQTAPYSGDN